MGEAPGYLRKCTDHQQGWEDGADWRYIQDIARSISWVFGKANGRSHTTAPLATATWTRSFGPWIDSWYFQSCAYLWTRCDHLPQRPNNPWKTCRIRTRWFEWPLGSGGLRGRTPSRSCTTSSVPLDTAGWNHLSFRVQMNSSWIPNHRSKWRRDCDYSSCKMLPKGVGVAFQQDDWHFQILKIQIRGLMKPVYKGWKSSNVLNKNPTVLSHQVEYSRSGTFGACHAGGRNPTSRNLSLMLGWHEMFFFGCSHGTSDKGACTFLKRFSVNSIHNDS